MPKEFKQYFSDLPIEEIRLSIYYPTYLKYVFDSYWFELVHNNSFGDNFSTCGGS